MVWVQLGYPIVIFMAALQRVDPELYEAAELDGANWFQRFRAITVGIIRPEIFVVTLTCTIAALKVFGPVYALTGGGPGTATIVPAYYAYSEFFQSQQVGYGATIATALTIVIAAVSVAFILVQNRAEKKEEAPMSAVARRGRGRRSRASVREPDEARAGEPSAGGGTKRRTASDWVVLVVAIVLGFFIAVPFLLILINSFKSPADYNTSGPLTLPTSLYFDGIVAFWERVDFPQKLWNSVFISGLVAVFAVALSMFNAFALGIGRVKGRLWIVVAHPAREHAAAGGAALPAVLHVQGGRALRQPVGRDHHLHRHPVGVRHLPARVGLRHVPEGAARGRRRSTAPAAGRSSGAWSIRSPGRRCRCCSSSSSSGRGTSS